MKKFFALLLCVLLLCTLCGCTKTNARDPLLFIPVEEDESLLTDRGILRVDDGFATAGALVLQRRDGTQIYYNDGPLNLPDGQASINQALVTTMTVAQARTVLEGLFSRVTGVLGSAGYLLKWCQADTVTEAPDYTYSVLDKTLTEGKTGVDESLGSFLVDDGDPMARIWIKP